jgi:GNAT superfamily N-acetyltransferase
VRIATGHDLTPFACGNPELDRWLETAALRADRMGTARTYVWIEPDASVVGYFSLAPHTVNRDQLPARLAHGAPDVVPVFLLARLALDQRLHARGLGSRLLVDALRRATQAVEIAGGRLIVVDAIDRQAIRFYQHHGFRASDARPTRLYRKASEVITAIAGR